MELVIRGENALGMLNRFADFLCLSQQSVHLAGLSLYPLQSETGKLQARNREIPAANREISLQGTGAAVQLLVGRAEDDFHCLARPHSQDSESHYRAGDV
jgi:hypothetical protein